MLLNGSESSGTAATFVEATGGGWFDVPDRIAANGGSQAQYVAKTLRSAYDYAHENGIEVGVDFEFTITDIPVGIKSPHEIVFGIMMESFKYGLEAKTVNDETFYFARTS